MINDNTKEFIRGYLITALWSSSDLDDDSKYLDENYTIYDFSYSTIKRIVKDCKKFIQKTEHILNRLTLNINSEFPYNYNLAGHDYWLTQNGHGCGFWNRYNEIENEQDRNFLTNMCDRVDHYFESNDNNKLHMI